MQGAGGGGGETSAIALLAQGNSTIQLLAQVGGQLVGEGLAGVSDQPTPCTLSLNILPAVKAGTRLASILIFSPVLGFRP